MKMTPVDFRDPNSSRVVVDHNSNHNQQIIVPRSPPPLKVNKDSRAIKKPSFSSSSSSSPPSSSSSTCKTQVHNNSNNQHRRPVIIYTHSPKVIQTKPEDFMALVQKLTGFSKDDRAIKEKKVNDHRDGDDRESFSEMDEENNKRNAAVNEGYDVAVDENEEIESSVITEEHGGNLGGGGHQVNSTPPCFLPPPPIFNPVTTTTNNNNNNNLFYSNNMVTNNQGFYSFSNGYDNDALLFGSSAAQNLRCTMIPSPSSSLDALNEFGEL